MKPLLLCIHMDKSRVSQLSFLAMGLGVTVKDVPEDDLGQTLGALCGLDPRKKDAPPAQAPEEMLVMAFFPEALFDRWLDVLRTSGMTPVRLKAVLTPTNRWWNCGKMYTVLCRETAAYELREQLKL